MDLAIGLLSSRILIMINIFMPYSGNMGDTLNVMPVLSGLSKSNDKTINLVLRDKMKMFNGIKEFLLMQDCIGSVFFESEAPQNINYYILSLVEDFTLHSNRPWETVRLEEFLRRNYDLKFIVDDSFILNVDEKVNDIPSKILVGDRMFHSEMDQRRKFNVLQSSGKFDNDEYYFLDYNIPVATNAAYLKYTEKAVISTFTGISVIADLLNKDCLVLWGEDIRDWAGQPIEYSFNKHFYRDRKCKLMYLGDYSFP